MTAMSSMHPHGHDGGNAHMHIVPPGIAAAAETGRFGMQLRPGVVKICGHGVPPRPISDGGKLVDRLHADHYLSALDPSLCRQIRKTSVSPLSAFAFRTDGDYP